MKKVLILFSCILFFTQCTQKKHNTAKDAIATVNDTVVKPINNFLDFTFQFKHSEVDIWCFKEGAIKTEGITATLTPILTDVGVREFKVEVTNDLNQQLTYSYFDYYKLGKSNWTIIPMGVTTSIVDYGWIVPPKSTRSTNWIVPAEYVFTPGSYRLFIEFRTDKGTNLYYYRVYAYFDLLEK